MSIYQNRMTTMIESEKKLEAALREMIKKMGGWSIKMEANFISGLPDRLCLLPNAVIFFAELKTTGKKPTKIQSLVHRRLSKMGFKIYLIDSIEELKRVIRIYE